MYKFKRRPHNVLIKDQIRAHENETNLGERFYLNCVQQLKFENDPHIMYKFKTNHKYKLKKLRIFLDYIMITFKKELN
jgi:hypothetical protein